MIAVQGVIFESPTMQKCVNLITFLWKLISKEQAVVIMEFPDWVQVKRNTIDCKEE